MCTFSGRQALSCNKIWPFWYCWPETRLYRSPQLEYELSFEYHQLYVHAFRYKPLKIWIHHCAIAVGFDNSEVDHIGTAWTTISLTVSHSIFHFSTLPIWLSKQCQRWFDNIVQPSSVMRGSLSADEEEPNVGYISQSTISSNPNWLHLSIGYGARTFYTVVQDFRTLSGIITG